MAVGRAAGGGAAERISSTGTVALAASELVFDVEGAFEPGAGRPTGGRAMG